MNFASIEFAIFLCVTVFLYYTFLRRYQWQLLLVASFVFYAFSGWVNVVFISVTTLTVYAAGLLIQRIPKAAENRARRKRVMVICLLINFAMLAVMKYANFAILNVNSLLGLDFTLPNFILPMAMSFYTFQTMGYIIDVHRGKEAERSLPRFALFATFFPQLVQGPISRHSDLAATLYNKHKYCADNFTNGLSRILIGLFKKMVIADRLIPVIRELTGGGVIIADGTAAIDGALYTGSFVLLSVFLYAITIFCDFTGGIDITIGIAKTLGITLKENFDRPFYSRGIAEYWRRWHITMGSWFRDYCFYPMSSSKIMFKFGKFARRVFGDRFGKRLPIYINTMILWFLTGLWHGASWNFIMWGLANGFAIIIEQEITPLFSKFNKRFDTQSKAAFRAWQIFRTFWIMNFIRAFDIYPSVGATFRAFGSIFTNFGAGRFSLAAVGLFMPDIIMLSAAVATLIVIGAVANRRKKEATSFARVVFCASIGFAILIFGAYGFGYDVNQFIYNQF
ncbi:MAG: MBOAT family protein [Defluviitaleaceae bacterium]|nr:MBOAT family protein [Defluviitaleaceae bacterium]